MSLVYDTCCDRNATKLAQYRHSTESAEYRGTMSVNIGVLHCCWDNVDDDSTDDEEEEEEEKEEYIFWNLYSNVTFLVASCS